MSRQSFQANLARLVIDLEFRARVRAHGAAALEGELTALERARLTSAANDRGLDATRMLYTGFRLSKLLITLPLTCTLLGPARLRRATQAFWATHPPVSFYFISEALKFCDFLLARSEQFARASAYLAEVVAYERALLELQWAHANGEAPRPQVLTFQHDPARLLGPLAAGRRPRRVPVAPCVLTGSLDADGNPQWEMSAKKQSPAASAAPRTRRRRAARPAARQVRVAR